ncbi:hypothetical protein AOLI_G00111620 [Acnodon oligacanthus]
MLDWLTLRLILPLPVPCQPDSSAALLPPPVSLPLPWQELPGCHQVPAWQGKERLASYTALPLFYQSSYPTCISLPAFSASRQSLGRWEVVWLKMRVFRFTPTSQSYTCNLAERVRF